MFRCPTWPRRKPADAPRRPNHPLGGPRQVPVVAPVWPRRRFSAHPMPAPTRPRRQPADEPPSRAKPPRPPKESATPQRPGPASHPPLRRCGKFRRGPTAAPAPPQRYAAHSIDRPENRPDLGVSHCEIPQQVIVPCASLCKLAVAKRQMAVGIQTRGNAKGVR